MAPAWVIIISAVVAFAATLWIHPYVLELAKRKHITDDPDARKLQRSPVPVLGGLAVFFGILTGLLAALCLFDCCELFFILLAGGIMLFIGSVDDILGLSPGIRFAVEILISLLIIFGGHFVIDDFHGVLNIHQISPWVAVPLTVLTIVGIVNAINLIDGVDGLCSGFCIVASILFGCVFASSGDWSWALLAFICAGALFPFFLHNVFGSKSHIYIGDGGTLLMGTILAAFVIAVLHSGSHASQLLVARPGLSLIAMVLAFLAEPVADCLRVMGWRLAKGLSPFKPDRTHLHHLFIDARFSHLFTTFAIIAFNLIVVGVWYLSYRLGVGKGWQVAVVIVMGLIVTQGFYAWMATERKKDSRTYRRFVWVGIHTHFKRSGFWRRMRNLMDRK